MKNEKLEILKDLVIANITPIVVEDASKLFLFTQLNKSNLCVIDALKSETDLQLSASEMPNWLEEVNSASKDAFNFLVIDNFFDISQDEQMKFYELLKDRKILNYKLADSVVVVIKGKSFNFDKINSNIVNLVCFA